MNIHYRRNRTAACYDSVCLETVTHTLPEPLVGPHAHCAGCPYPAHGFLCWRKSGECLRTEMTQIIGLQGGVDR